MKNIIKKITAILLGVLTLTSVLITTGFAEETANNDMIEEVYVFSHKRWWEDTLPDEFAEEEEKNPMYTHSVMIILADTFTAPTDDLLLYGLESSKKAEIKSENIKVTSKNNHLIINISGFDYDGISIEPGSFEDENKNLNTRDVLYWKDELNVHENYGSDNGNEQIKIIDMDIKINKSTRGLNSKYYTGFNVQLGGEIDKCSFLDCSDITYEVDCNNSEVAQGIFESDKLEYKHYISYEDWKNSNLDYVFKVKINSSEVYSRSVCILSRKEDYNNTVTASKYAFAQITAGGPFISLIPIIGWMVAPTLFLGSISSAFKLLWAVLGFKPKSI